jgi:hypothetical protein
MRCYMQSKTFEAHFAARSAKTASSLDQIARALRAEGLLPSGARGRHAPRLEPEQLANFLIAACMSSSPAEAVQTVKDFGSLIPIVKLKKKQLSLFKEAGVPTEKINLHHYLTCIFWAGWDDAQKHIEQIAFRRLPPHPDLRYRFEVEIDGQCDWTNTFQCTVDYGDVTTYIRHSDAERTLMLESVVLGRDFLRGLFRANGIPS